MIFVCRKRQALNVSRVDHSHFRPFDILTFKKSVFSKIISAILVLRIIDPCDANDAGVHENVAWDVIKTSPFRERRCDVASRSTDDGETVRTIERIPQSAHSICCHHCKTRRPCSSEDPVNNPPCDSAPHERHDKVACGDFTGNRGKEFTSTSYHGTSIDLDGGAEEGVVTNDARGRGPDIKDAWTRANTLTTHRKIVDSTWRCERHPREDSIPNLSKSSCDRCRDGCYHCHDYRCDYSHHCCYQQRDSSCINVKGLIGDLFTILRKIAVRQVSTVTHFW